MRHTSLWLACGLVAGALFAGSARADETLPISSLDIKKVHQGYGKPGKNLSVDEHPLTIAGEKFESGIGTHADSELSISLDGQASKFTARVGLDDEIQGAAGSIVFYVLLDGQVKFKSDVMKAGQKAADVNVDLTGGKSLSLIVSDAGDGMNFDHANWADAKITYAGKAPVAADSPSEEAVILTPAAPATPRINGAKVFGVRPGNPLLYQVAATGDRPMTFEAEGLPEGATLDKSTGLISGSLYQPGSYAVKVTATNAKGKAERTIKFEVGDKIALTPPMGWNSWNCFASAVTEEKVKAAADAMVNSGLQQHGWNYINVDDFWEKNPGSKDPTLGGPGRDAKGKMVPNPRFPDMKGLGDYIHAKGLKFGIYSSPGPTTCGGCLGSYDHELQDAESYTEWGVDYLKYDWCSYNPRLETRRKTPIDIGEITLKGQKVDDKRADEMRPYVLMGKHLKAQPRDIVYSLCQYGKNNVWEWGDEVGGQCWRTTGDITDTWGSLSSIGFNQDGHEKFTKPGNWSDPDMLIVGMVGWGPRLHPTKLTPNEQYTHISLWCLLASPLLIGCDMTQMDDFTKNLLTNDEVLEVNQDPLGKGAGRVEKGEFIEVWSKEMEDGSRAIGIFNRGPMQFPAKVDLSKTGLSGKLKLRDLWRQKDLGEAEGAYEVTVPRHGCVLLRAWPAK